MELDSLPPRLEYLRPVIQHFVENPLSEPYEDTDTSVLEDALRKRIKGLTGTKAEKTLREDRKALAAWIANSKNPDSPAHFILGWMMMGVGPLLGNDDMIGTVSDMISDLPTAPPRRDFGPLPTIEAVKSDLLRDDGNLFLYVSNSTGDPKQVDICVAIDGNIVVHDVFEHQLMNEFIRYRIHIPIGKHRIVATSQRADVRLEETFVMGNVLHACIRFWYSSPSAVGPELPASLTFHAEEEAWVPEYGWRLPN